MGDYKKAFPDFTPETMPDTPESWLDVSWHNDSCPSFLVMQGGEGDSNFTQCRVWIDYMDSALRDVQGAARFSVTFESDNLERQSELAFQSDNFAEILAWIEIRRFLAAQYVKRVGHNPFLDSPDQSPEQVLLNLAWHMAQA